jgi:hypothetical protein
MAARVRPKPPRLTAWYLFFQAGGADMPAPGSEARRSSPFVRSKSGAASTSSPHLTHFWTVNGNIFNDIEEVWRLSSRMPCRTTWGRLGYPTCLWSSRGKSRPHPEERDSGASRAVRARMLWMQLSTCSIKYQFEGPGRRLALPLIWDPRLRESHHV